MLSPPLRLRLFARRCLWLFPAPAGLFVFSSPSASPFCTPVPPSVSRSGGALLSPLLWPLLFARRCLHLFPAPAGLFVFSSPSAPPFCTPAALSISRSGGAFRLLLPFGPSFLHAGGSVCFPLRRGFSSSPFLRLRFFARRCPWLFPAPAGLFDFSSPSAPPFCTPVPLAVSRSGGAFRLLLSFGPSFLHAGASGCFPLRRGFSSSPLLRPLLFARRCLWLFPAPAGLFVFSSPSAPPFCTPVPLAVSRSGGAFAFSSPPYPPFCTPAAPSVSRSGGAFRLLLSFGFAFLHAGGSVCFPPRRGFSSSPPLRLHFFARRCLWLFPAPAGLFVFSSPSASLFCTPVPLAVSRSGGAFRLLLSSVSAFLHAGASFCLPLRRGFSSSPLLRICLFARRCLFLPPAPAGLSSSAPLRLRLFARRYLHLFPAPAGLFIFCPPSASLFCTPVPLAVSRPGGAFHLLLPFGFTFLHAGAPGYFPLRRGFSSSAPLRLRLFARRCLFLFPPRRGFSSSPLLRPLLFARRCLSLPPAPAGLFIFSSPSASLFCTPVPLAISRSGGAFAFSSPSASLFCTPVPLAISRSGGAFRLLLSSVSAFLHAGGSIYFPPRRGFSSSPLLRPLLFARRCLHLFPAPAGLFVFSSPLASLFCTPVPLAVSRPGGAFRLLLSSVSAFLHAGGSIYFPLRRGFSSSLPLRPLLFARRCLHLFPAPAGLFVFSSPSAPPFCTPVPPSISRSGGAFRLLTDPLDFLL